MTAYRYFQRTKADAFPFGIKEVVNRFPNQSAVSSIMSRMSFLFRNFRLVGFLPEWKNGNTIVFRIGNNTAARSHNLCYPRYFRGKCRHRKVNQYVTGEFDIDYLMIDNCVVAPKYAAAVRSCFEIIA